MANTVIKVENSSRQYRPGTVGTGSLGHDLNRTWQKVGRTEGASLNVADKIQFLKRTINTHEC